MHEWDYKYISFHHQDNWNAELCKGGRIKRKCLTKTSDMMKCAGLFRLKAVHSTRPQITVGDKRVLLGWKAFGTVEICEGIPNLCTLNV